MKKLLLVSLCFLLLGVAQVFAQSLTVTGLVTAREDGGPIPGVSVTVKGTTTGVITGADGKYSINVPASSSKILVFRFIGYGTVEKSIGSGSVVNASLEIASRALGEVVVTATLGRQVQEKATGYAETHITAVEANISAPTNFLTGLEARVAGLNITQTGTGVDAGIKVQLRGSRSIAGNNQALIVVDGVPLPSGDISAIDPNSILTYDVLNGSSAGVLYGQEASNGAILITTRKGSETGKPTVSYSNSIQAQQVAYYPKFQTQFGQYGGETLAQGGLSPITGNTQLIGYENELYGPAYDGRSYQLGAPADSAKGPVLMQIYSPQSKNPEESFYKTGITEQNSVSIASGNQDDYFNLSVQNVLIHGITPTETNFRNNATIKAGKRYGIFKAEYSLSYTNTAIHQVGSDYYSAAGQSVNYALQQFPGSLNINDFKDPTSTFANPNNYYSDYSVNPWWAVYNSASNTTRNVFLGQAILTLNPTKFLDVTYKLSQSTGTYENKSTRAEVDFSPYAISDYLQGGNIPSAHPTGLIQGTVSDSYATGDGSGTTNGYGRLESDLYFNLHHTFFNDFKTSLLLGTTYYNQHQKNESASGTALLVNGLYNIAYNGSTPTASETEFTINTLSFFTDAQISYKDYAFLDATLRNDRDSRLTPANQSFYYPGVQGSFVFTDAIPALKGNKILSFGKLRASYGVTAQVNLPAYSIQDTFGVSGGFPYGALGGLSLSTTHYTQIVPEKNTEIEMGAELGFFDGRITGQFTYYNQHDRNQTLNLTTSPSAGYSSVVTNVGELQSYGYEANVTVSLLTKAKNKVQWDITANLADQESKVISILANAPSFNVNSNQYAVVGEPYPVVKATDYLRDPQGRTVISTSTGYPITNPIQADFGRSSPQYIFTPRTTISYKFISLEVVAEYRTGYIDQFTGETSYLFTGSSAYTTQNGRQRFIYPNSVYQDATGAYVPNTSISTADGNYKWWTGSVATTAGPYITSGAYWKIRDASLSFNLNQFVKNTKYIKGLRVALNGRNLFLWVPKTNFWGDPDVSAASGTSSANVGTVTSVNSIPASRYFGAKLDITL